MDRRHARRGTAAVAAALTITAAIGMMAQQPVDVSRLGPQVGDTAPAFAVPDQHGRTRTLASLLGPKGALLVFFRSADW